MSSSRENTGARASGRLPEPEPCLEDLAGARLLVVEDDRDSRAALELLLEDWGFEVVTAASGEAAIALGPRAAASLAVLDVELPGCDGFAVRAALRALDPALPVLFLSGSERHLATGDRDPRTRYLMKPVNLAALEAALRELLEARRAVPPAVS